MKFAASLLVGMVFCPAGPALADDWIERCRVAAAIGEPAACERAVETAPGNPQAYRLLGQAYFNADRLFESRAAYEEALRLAPRDPDLHYELAAYQVLVNEYESGAMHLEQAVAIDRRHRQSWTLLATCYRYMSLPARALAATRRAAELGDSIEAYALARYYAAGLEGLQKNPVREREWLQRAARSGHFEAMRDLAEFYARGREGIPPDPAKSRYWEAKIADTQPSGN